MSLDVAATGYLDYALRQAEREGHGHGRALLAAGYRPVSGAFGVERQRATPASALEEDFTWHGEGRVVGLSARVGDRRVLHSPMWLPQEWDLALNERRSGLFLNQGYPLTLDEQFDLLAPGSKGTQLPPAARNDAAPLRWSLEWAEAGNGRLTARFHAELPRGELSLTEAAAFQDQLRALRGALAADVAFSP